MTKLLLSALLLAVLVVGFALGHHAGSRIPRCAEDEVWTVSDFPASSASELHCIHQDLIAEQVGR